MIHDTVGVGLQYAGAAADPEEARSPDPQEGRPPEAQEGRPPEAQEGRPPEAQEGRPHEAPPVPETLAETGLTMAFVGDLLLKVLQLRGAATGAELADTVRLPFMLLEHDARYIRVLRPVVSTGGELTLDQLEMNFDAASRIYQAPAQVKANGGVLILDDFGRQRVPSRDLLNRWMVPLEQRRELLALNTGTKFTVPFDCLLIFATNLDPSIERACELYFLSSALPSASTAKTMEMQ
jgi:hypothetical protein